MLLTAYLSLEPPHLSFLMDLKAVMTGGGKWGTHVSEAVSLGDRPRTKYSDLSDIGEEYIDDIRDNLPTFMYVEYSNNHSNEKIALQTLSLS